MDLDSQIYIYDCLSIYQISINRRNHRPGETILYVNFRNSQIKGNFLFLCSTVDLQILHKLWCQKRNNDVAYCEDLEFDFAL